MRSTVDQATQTARTYYNSQDADRFYAEVWGGEDIHVGLYRSESESIKDASRRTVEHLAERLVSASNDHDDVKPIGSGSVVLDLGSGYGGAARYLVNRFGCRVVCMNLSEAENARNREWNQREGLADRIEVIDGSFQSLPIEDGSIDFVWSQDAILHSGDRRGVLGEVHRVLRPGGSFVFTDPMQSDGCRAGTLVPILARIHLTDLGSPDFYRRVAADLGWHDRGFEDHSAQLVAHYSRVLETTRSLEGELSKTISSEYLGQMKTGLGHWVDGGRRGDLVWGVFLFSKSHR